MLLSFDLRGPPPVSLESSKKSNRISRDVCTLPGTRIVRYEKREWKCGYESYDGG